MIISAGMSAADAAIQNKIHGSEIKKLIISKEKNEIWNIMKIVKSFEESGLLIKGINEIIRIKAKEQKGRFLPPMLLGT